MAFAFLAQLRFLFRFVPVKLEHHVHGASLPLTVRRRSHCRKEIRFFMRFLPVVFLPPCWLKSSRTTSYSCADKAKQQETTKQTQKHDYAGRKYQARAAERASEPSQHSAEGATRLES
ncbi:hypothetical protein EJB05_21215 [Eragrostis curvula]|uniref:Uncharacterized protein n=1 Tax=Eragrostis curvula TaxID=38414 RepID=A0A5J9V0J9_9POAL|nr:hypothetical protein EJB05_21215 [Eragrostis curvula]